MTEVPPADALVVVDVQCAFVFGPHAVPDARRLLAGLDVLLARARAAHALVVHLQNDGRQGAPDESGTVGWELAIAPQDGEVVLRKHSDSGFAGTVLEDLLRRRKAACLAIAGVQSEMCVAATAREALARGFTVVLPHDAHATYPIPEQTGFGPAVPADQVSRVAEWSLGDEVFLARGAADVRFRRSSPSLAGDL